MSKLEDKIRGLLERGYSHYRVAKWIEDALEEYDFNEAAKLVSEVMYDIKAGAAAT